MYRAAMTRVWRTIATIPTVRAVWAPGSSAFFALFA